MAKANQILICCFFLFHFGYSQTSQLDSIIIQISYCQNPTVENYYQPDAEKYCLNGKGGVFSKKLAMVSVKHNGYYREEIVLGEIIKMLSFLDIAGTEPMLSLLEVRDLDDFWERFYAFVDKEGRHQRFGVIFPK